jgi:Flp pilus assembly protein TadD
VYGLLSTGVVELNGRSHSGSAPAVVTVDVDKSLEAARSALASGRAEEALTSARSVIGVRPESTEARLVAARALRRLKRLGEAAEELRHAAEISPDHPDIHLELGYAALDKGDFTSAVDNWKRYLEQAPSAAGDAIRIREALASANFLRGLLQGHSSG